MSYILYVYDYYNYYMYSILWYEEKQKERKVRCFFTPPEGSDSTSISEKGKTGVRAQSLHLEDLKQMRRYTQIPI